MLIGCVPIRVRNENDSRNNQQAVQGTSKRFFDMADKGQKVIIKKGSKQAYVLTPVSEDDLYFTPQMIERIKESQQEIKEGKYTSFKNVDELDEFIRSM